MDLDGIEVEALKDGSLLVVRHDFGRRLVQRVAPENPMHSFFFPLANQDVNGAADPLTREMLTQWLASVGPKALDDYPDVNPTEFRFPWCEKPRDLVWCGVDSPFITFISGRAGSGKTSLLSGIRTTASGLNRTEVVSLQYSEDFPRMDLALTRIGQELGSDYRLNTTASNNPFRKKSKIFLIDDFPSTSIPSRNEEMLMGALYDFLSSVQGVQEFVKVFVASERPLSDLMLGATGGTYGMVSEVSSSEMLLEVSNRVSPSAALGADGLESVKGDLLGWNLWCYREVRQGYEVETLVKSPQVDVKEIKQFVADGAPDEIDVVDVAEDEEVAAEETLPDVEVSAPQRPAPRHRPTGSLPEL